MKSTTPKDTERLLRLLREVAITCASSKTSCNPYLYEQNQKNKIQLSPLEGHCAIISFVVHKLFNANIVHGKVMSIQHYWNRLPNGKEIDLTSCQFRGGNGWNPLKKGTIYKVNKSLITPTYLNFYNEILQKLKSKEKINV